MLDGSDIFFDLITFAYWLIMFSGQGGFFFRMVAVLLHPSSS